MSDDTSKRGPQDRSRVNVHEDYEIAYWTERFGVSAKKLQEAVRKVGSSVRDIEAYLKREKK